MSDVVANRRPLLWIVDDSATERSHVIAALGDAYRYEQFGDGADVIERLGGAAALPDAILLDWVMPGVSGDNVCRYVRSQPHTAELPLVIVTSSRIETGDIVTGLHAGANDYVPKPFAVEELRARVASVLRQKQLREEAARERRRLDAINHLGRTLFEAGPSVERIFDELLATLTGLVADGCAIVLLPGELPMFSASRHNADPTGEGLAAISSLADPGTFSFESSAAARAQLPPKYHAYIERFGLRGLAIFPFPILTPVEGVITLTRDGRSEPFDAQDLSTIETCIEYARLAVQNATRFLAERSARGQLHTILEHAPIGIVVTDPGGAITLANPAARHLVPGIAELEHVSGVYALGRWSTIAGQAIASNDWTFGRTGPVRRELMFATGDLPRRVLSVSSVELRDAGGTVTAIEDVTSQHAVLDERESTAAFQERMLGIVGHDLRNPLNAVITGAELMIMRPTDASAVTTNAKRILASGKRMTSIVDLLLDVTRSRLGAGMSLSLADTALAPIVEAVVQELSSNARVPSRFDLALEDIRGVWDADRLSQVISNLASNATQYGRPGSAVRINAIQVSDVAHISVWNENRDRPISPERLASLFDPFRRGDNGALHRTGLGLGLYIAHEIVRAHHGKIFASSSVEGTVFTVELPVKPVGIVPDVRATGSAD